MPGHVMLLTRHVASEHGQDALNGSLARARGVVAVTRAQYLRDSKPLIHLVGQNAQPVAAALRVQDPGEPALPNE
jgi:hypothetical protein